MEVIHVDASTGWPAPIVRRNVSAQAGPDTSKNAATMTTNVNLATFFISLPPFLLLIVEPLPEWKTARLRNKPSDLFILSAED
jgi:hypothetical protein